MRPYLRSRMLILALMLANCADAARDEGARTHPPEAGSVTLPAADVTMQAPPTGGKPTPFEPSQVYQGEGPPFARVVLRPEGSRWRVSLFGGSDPRPGGPGASDCHIEGEGSRVGDRIKASFIPGTDWAAQSLFKEPRWIDLEFEKGAVRVSTDVFAWCGLGANFDGRYRKLPAASHAAGEARVQGLTGLWRVVAIGEFRPPDPYLRDDSQDFMGATLEITPEHLAWVGRGLGGRSDWEAYCASPRLEPATAAAETGARQALAKIPSTENVPVGRAWTVECAERIGFAGSPLLVRLADDRLALRTNSERLLVLSPVGASGK